MSGSFEEYVSGRGQALLRFGYLLTGDRQLSEDLILAAVERRPRGPDLTGTTFYTLTLRVSPTTVLEFSAQSPVWTVDRLKAFAAGVTYTGPTQTIIHAYQLRKRS